MKRRTTRLALLVSIGAVAVGASGCDWLAVIDAAQRCAHGDEAACTDGVRVEPSAARSTHASGAAAAAGKGFRLRLGGKIVGKPTIYAESGGASAGQTLARGRFNGSLLKDTRLSSRFERGRWAASTDFYYDADTRAMSGHAFVRVRFAQRRAGSVCLYVNVTRARMKNGGLRETGLVIPMGGSRLGSRLTGRTQFVAREGARRTRTRGKTGLRLGRTSRKPTTCGTLPRLR
ncbi:MAG TPA: hypothetical protein VGF25_21560 [Thermoleophilaceae bacterium]|jgi:hypothetical protein